MRRNFRGLSLARSTSSALITRWGTRTAFDSDAQARVTQIETAKGSGMTLTQKNAINAFIVAEKTAGRWTAHKRLFLPIWANASANAVDLITGALCTFVASPTHGAGYVEGNGSTQYVDLGVSPSGAGMTAASGGYGHIALSGSGGGGVTHMGCQNSGSQAMFTQWFSSTGVRMAYNDTGGGLLSQGAGAELANWGIVSCQRQGGQRRITRRTGDGSLVLATGTAADSGTIPTVNVHAMGFNNNGTPSISSVMRYGAFWLNTGFSSADDLAFTANLKTLWETLTGLTLVVDSDAAARITQIETAKGSSMTAVQSQALKDFIVTEKLWARWASHKRIYLPVWGNSGANSICLVTGDLLTWVNAPTMAAGYVQGNGSTQCARDNSTPSGLGFTTTTGAMFALIIQADSRTDARYFVGARTNNSPADGECSQYQISATQINSIIGRVPSVPVGFVSGVARTGIFHTNRNAAQGVIVSRRGSGGVTRGPADTGTSAITAAQAFNYMALRDGAFDSAHTDARMGAFGVGLGLAANADVDAFTSNLKTMYESVTSIALPA